MKLLLLADLHDCTPWYEWAAAQSVDAILIAGDLLDGFSEEGLLPQILRLEKWCAACPIPLVLSSGNHDANHDALEIDTEIHGKLTARKEKEAAPFFVVANWMDALTLPGGVTDGRSEVVKTGGGGGFVVTTLPYLCDEGVQNDILCIEGGKLRVMHRLPWIILHHEPPEGTEVGGEMGDPWLPWRIQEYSPDFLLSGHIHDQPYRGNFCERIGRTWCFNPGRNDKAKPPKRGKETLASVPNHIVLDLGKKTATWSAVPLSGKERCVKSVVLS